MVRTLGPPYFFSAIRRVRLPKPQRVNFPAFFPRKRRQAKSWSSPSPRSRGHTIQPLTYNCLAQIRGHTELTLLLTLLAELLWATKHGATVQRRSGGSLVASAEKWRFPRPFWSPRRPILVAPRPGWSSPRPHQEECSSPHGALQAGTPRLRSQEFTRLDLVKQQKNRIVKNLQQNLMDSVKQKFQLLV